MVSTALVPVWCPLSLGTLPCHILFAVTACRIVGLGAATLVELGMVVGSSSSKMVVAATPSLMFRLLWSLLPPWVMFGHSSRTVLVWNGRAKMTASVLRVFT